MTDQGEGNPESRDSAATLDQHRQAGQVQSVYDEIASHFSKTRAYPWPEVEAFLDRCDSVEDGRRRGLDIGCGNGRHTAPLAKIVDRAIGLDLSRELLHEARGAMQGGRAQNAPPDSPHAGNWRATMVQGDARAFPIASDAIDVALYVATVHHLSNREARVESLRELCRVLAPDGVALVSAWSTEHERFAGKDEGFDTTIDWTLPGGETVPRFYHIYAPSEFEVDLQQAGFSIVSLEVSSGNCYATVSTAAERKHP